MFCSKCGTQVPVGNPFCSSCGQNVDPTAQVNEVNCDYGARPPKPDSYLVWAILVTILCCLPLGVVSIVQAVTVNNRYDAGDYEGAKRASRSAKNWTIWSAIIGVVGGIIYCICVFALGLAGALI